MCAAMSGVIATLRRELVLSHWRGEPAIGFYYFVSGTSNGRPLNDRHRQTDSPGSCNGPLNPHSGTRLELNDEWECQSVVTRRVRRRRRLCRAFVCRRWCVRGMCRPILQVARLTRVLSRLLRTCGAAR